MFFLSYASSIHILIRVQDRRAGEASTVHDTVSFLQQFLLLKCTIQLLLFATILYVWLCSKNAAVLISQKIKGGLEKHLLK
jgi:hypothetical protein